MSSNNSLNKSSQKKINNLNNSNQKENNNLNKSSQKKNNSSNLTKLVKNINIKNRTQTQIIFKNNNKLKFNGISYRIIGEGGIQSVEFKIDPGKYILVTPGNMNVWNSKLKIEIEWANKNKFSSLVTWASTDESIIRVTNPIQNTNTNINKNSLRMDVSSNFIGSIGTIYFHKVKQFV